MRRTGERAAAAAATDAGRRRMASAHLGVTEPISLEAPRAEHLAASRDLHATLRAADLFESDEESLRRERVLGRLAHDHLDGPPGPE